jgi:2-methylisocitrate lyase-like PEP mutase family enzyme
MNAFLDLHQRGNPLLIPNPWDVGSARILEQLGFAALATTSSGFAATLGRSDGSVSRDEALAHAAAVATAVEVPVSADLENGFSDDPDGVADTVRRAASTGLAGCSIEDAGRHADAPVYDVGLAVERVAAAVEAAQQGADGLIITARAENYLYGRTDLADTIDRLQRYQQAGAHVLYAPGVRAPDELRTLIGAVDRPVNVLALPNTPTVAELAELGAARISIGGSFAWVAYGALIDAGREFREAGTYDFLRAAAANRSTINSSLALPPNQG